MNRTVIHATFSIALSFGLLPACSAAVPNCKTASLWLTPFGSFGTPAPRISIPANIRSQLPHFVAARQVLHSHLSPQGEQVIIYDSEKDDDAPLPQLAFVVRGKVATAFDAAEEGTDRGGFERFQSACEFNAAPNVRAIAFAYTSAGDGAGSAFAIVMWRSGHYQTVFRLQGDQSQLVLSQNSITLWNNEGTGGCIWCPSKYETVRYSWQNGTYVKTSTNKRKMLFDPAFVSGTPLRK
jgi:hypothetical protein